MDQVSFARVARHEWRVRLDGETVGDILRMPDILKAGATVFMIHLDEDTRGPLRVHDAGQVRAETERMIRTHPLW